MNNADMIFRFEYLVEPQIVDCSLTVRQTAIETMLLNSAGKAADQLGIGVEDLRKDNYAWVVARIAWEMDYRPKIGSTIVVETWIDHVEHMFSIRNFRILQGDVQIGLGKSIWTVLNLSSRRPVNLMTEERFIALNTNIDNGMSQPIKIGAVENQATYNYKTVYSDIDFNGHCNSVQYIQWMLNALSVEEATALSPKRVDINYLHEVLPEENISIAYLRNGDNLIFEVRNADGKPAARAAMKL